MTHAPDTPTTVFLLAGSLLLAAHPVAWLVGTWLDPAYDSVGLLVAATVVLLLGWSLSSPAGAPPHSAIMAGLIATALLRLLAQVLAINALGALTIAVDVWLIGRWLGLAHRMRPLAPGWLAVTFALSLPIERIVQRVLGFAMQSLSAEGACVLLAPLGPTRCSGIAIHHAGTEVLVDLPCAGAGGLTLQLVLFTALAALGRPSARAALLGLGVALGGALAANMLRVALLTAGLVHTPLDTLAEPWHSLIGYAALALGALPVLLWARIVRPLPPAERNTAPVARNTAPRLPRPAGFVFMAAALVIVLLPARPADVSAPLTPPHLPAVLAGAAAAPQPLSRREQTYFTLYGGVAARAGYGGNALLLVSTTAPLRHLHAPDECLEGAGHVVRFLGSRDGSALYRSTDPDGGAWRVRVSFLSDQGEAVATVAEAVWHWLRRPGGRWTMVQRISPWDAPAAAWEAAVTAAFDLPTGRESTSAAGLSPASGPGSY